jgi:hypothetical protein
VLVRWLDGVTPTWTTLKRLHGRKLEWLSRVAVVVCPAVAIIYTYLEAARLVPLEPLENARRLMPMELIALYFVALPYAVGGVFFDLCCPADIKVYQSSDIYVREYYAAEDSEQAPAGRSALRRAISANAPEILADITPELEVELTELLDDVTEPEANWAMQNRSRLPARMITTLLFGLSILLSIVVLVWTTPRHVFHLSSPAEVIGYLFGN